MTDQAENPRARRGSNLAPPAAQAVTEQMAQDYAEMSARADELLTEARALAPVEDDPSLRLTSAAVVQMRDLAARSEATRTAEKEPYLRGGQAVDGFFNPLKERLEKAMAVLSKRAHEYQTRKVAEERRQRAEAERLAAKAAREAAEKITAEKAAADAAEAAAQRTARPSRAEGHLAKAEQHDAAAEAAKVDLGIAQENLEAARAASAAPPADLARTRFEEGTLVTMRQVGFAEVTDDALLDATALWPFVKPDHKAMALRTWAKVNGFKKQMPGAAIGMRDDTVIR
jgi:hypothetical protein